jgi:hypothetical protein
LGAARGPGRAARPARPLHLGAAGASEVTELAARVEFRDCPKGPWQVGSATLRAELVNHRGTSLGIRVEDGGASLAYLPDQEPALGCRIEDAEREWISGLALAAGCDLLLHDAQ